MRTNTPDLRAAHESALSPLQQLRRQVVTCMLFEDTFYAPGHSLASSLADVAAKCQPHELAQVALDARYRQHLRHVPLFLTVQMLNHFRKSPLRAELVAEIIGRPDEMGELLALYQKGRDKKAPLPHALRSGLAKAFLKFNEYQLAKWDRPGGYTLRDVMFLCHPKPQTEEQAELFRRVANCQLATPDTWEVALSSGADKKATWERLIEERKLGGLAILRNLRNMAQAGVSLATMDKAIRQGNYSRVLPFRFLAAHNHARVGLEAALEEAMLASARQLPKLEGKTAVLVDHSMSMESSVSVNSEITRFQAAAALAMIFREMSDDTRVFTFSRECVEAPARKGFALLEAMNKVRNPVSTLLGKAVDHVYREFPECERLIVITDEQSQDTPRSPQGRGYIVNVHCYADGIGWGDWITINGWSDQVVGFMQEVESWDA